MRDLVELSRNSEDERVRSVCLVAILDRAGIRPYDADPAAEEAQDRRRGAAFRPSVIR